MSYEVVIVGAGPAGGMAACRLAEAGVRVLLLDRASLPRPKACGGGLGPGVDALIDWDISPVVQHRVSTSRWILQGRPVVEVEQGTMLMINRAEFDMHFVERALRIGGGCVELRDNFEVNGVEEDDSGVTVVSRGGERIRARYVIGADGALGKVARSVGLARKARHGIAIDAEVEVEPEVLEAEKNRLTFDLSSIRYGYGWTFPKRDVLSCGVGSWSGRVQVPPALDAYLSTRLPAGSIRSVVRRGHPIPLWTGNQPLATKRVCLVGDAASLVDPILGEGIRFAIASGRLAAEAIVDQLSGPGDGLNASGDFSGYTEQIESSVGNAFETLRKIVVPIFLQSPEFFFRKFFEGRVSYVAFARALSSRLSRGAIA